MLTNDSRSQLLIGFSSTHSLISANVRSSMVRILILQYLLTIYLVITGFFTPVMLIVLFSLAMLVRIWPMFKAPEPADKPADYPDVWPN